jgi:hypothetical protein
MFDTNTAIWLVAIFNVGLACYRFGHDRGAYKTREALDPNSITNLSRLPASEWAKGREVPSLPKHESPNPVRLA